MKKFILLLLSAILLLLTACGKTDSSVIRVAAMKGATAIGMVKIADKYDLQLGTLDEVGSLLVTNQLDVAVIPSNVAAAIYNKSEGKIKVAAITTLGVLYVVESGDSIQSLSDLSDAVSSGRKIYATGKGAIPEVAISKICNDSGVADIIAAIEWKSEPAEVIPLLAQDADAIAILPQPFVAVAQDKIPALRVALDVTKLWDETVTDESSFITGVLVVRTAFYEANPDVFSKFMKDFKKSAEYSTSNVSATAKWLASVGIVPSKEIGEAAIPSCNSVFIDGDELKTQYTAFLNVLYESNPSFIDGKVPDDGIY